MASQGPNSGATFSSVSRGVGSTVWLNTGNASASDNAYAQIVGTTNLSQYLQATNFSFSIPSGGTVNGILVEVEQKTGATGAGFESSVKIVKGGSILGTDKSTNISLSPSDTYRSYGGSADLWGLTWADTDINASTFGVGFSIGNGGKGTGSCDVDHIRITVFYTAVAAGAPAQNPLFPNPANKGFPTNLRTFLNPAETQLFGLDKFFGDAGEPPVSRCGNITVGRPLNVSLRTFINQMIRVSATAYTQSLSALLSFSADIGKQSGKPLTSSLTSSSVLAHAITKSLSAGLTSSSNLAHLIGKFLSAGISSAANLAHATAKPLSGSLTSSAAASKAMARSSSGSVTSSSVIQKATSKFQGGSVSLASALTNTRLFFLSMLASITSSTIIAKFSSKNEAGSLASIGVTQKSNLRTLLASIAPTAILARLSQKQVAGTQSSIGNIFKSSAKRLSGCVSSSGNLNVARFLFIQILAAVTSSGLISKQSSKSLSGQVNSSSTLLLTRELFLAISAAISPSAIVSKLSNKVASGAVSSTSAIVFVRTLFMTLLAAISPNGIARKQSRTLFAGTINSDGTIRKSIGKFVSSVANFILEITSLALGRRFKLDVTCSSFAVTTIESAEQSTTSCSHSVSAMTLLSFTESSATRLTIAARRLISTELAESVFA